MEPVRSNDKPGKDRRVLITFVLAGPPIGTLLSIVWAARENGLPDIVVGSLGDAILEVVGFILFAYPFGLIPAAATGALSSALSPHVRRLGVWLAASALVGAGLSCAMIAFLTHGLAGAPEATAAFAVIGAVAALTCAWLSRNFRQKPA